MKECAEEAGTTVQGGQTVVNPWLIIGGVATSVCTQSEIIIPENAIVGDVLVLTKPLGTQVAVNAHQWIENPDRWNRIKSVISEDDVRKAYQRAMNSMARLNKIGESTSFIVSLFLRIQFSFQRRISYAQIQCSCLHGCNRFRIIRSCTKLSKTSKTRCILCYTQFTHHRKNGRSQ